VRIAFSLSPIGHPRPLDLNPLALLGFIAFSRFHRNARDLKDRGFVITRQTLCGYDAHYGFLLQHARVCNHADLPVSCQVSKCLHMGWSRILSLNIERHLRLEGRLPQA
jgi:hypothetical protein